MSLKHLFLLFVFLKNIYFISNDYPAMDEICFQIKNTTFKTNEEFMSTDFCLKNNGYIKNIDCRNLGYPDENICQLCCKLTCGINGTLVDQNCREKEANCLLRKNSYWIDVLNIFDYEDRHRAYFDLLSPILYLFKFDYYVGDCYFQSREDLLINFANQINGKFIYSLGGGHKHFDSRLMDTSRGRQAIPKELLLYPTYGINGNSSGVSYEDENILGYDCSGLSMALIYVMGGYNFDREFTNAQKMYDIAKENNYLKNEIKIGYALFYGKSENSINHVTIALGENKMIEASGHFPNKKGKPIRIGNISENYIGIADFIYTPFKTSFKKEENEDNKSEVLRFNSIIILILLLL